MQRRHSLLIASIFAALSAAPAAGAQQAEPTPPPMQGHDMSKMQEQDTSKAQEQDMSEMQGQDMSKAQDTSKMQGHDMSKMQGQDMSKMQGHDMSKMQGHDMSKMQGHGMQGQSAGSMELHDTMMSGQKMSMPMSGNVDSDFASMMTMHHEKAIKMSDVLLKHGTDERLKAMARKMKAAQQKEIKELAPFKK